MSGADLAYQELLARAGIQSANAQGYDAARLSQMEFDAADDGKTVKWWAYGMATPTIIAGFQWFIVLEVGQSVPGWTPAGSLIVRKT